MRAKSIIRHATALLSQIFFVGVVSMAFWTLILTLFTGWTPTLVMSDSMMPSMRTGDITIASPMSIQDLKDNVKIGHVLLAENPAQPGSLYTHRVLSIEDNHTVFVTKGDANKTVDSTKLPIDKVKGMERVLVPYLGLPFQSAKEGNYLPFILFFILMFVSFILMTNEWRLVYGEEKAKSATLQNSSDSAVFENPSSTLPLPKGRRKATRKTHLSAKLFIAALMAIVITVSFTIGASFAAYSGKTKNIGCTWIAKSSFGAPVNSCWSGAYPTQNYTIYTNNNSFNNPQQIPYTANVTLQLNSSGTGFTFRYVSDRFVSNWYLQVVFTNSAGAKVTFRKQITGSTMDITWTDTTSVVSGPWVNFQADITDSNSTKPVYYYNGTALRINRC